MLCLVYTTGIIWNHNFLLSPIQGHLFLIHTSNPSPQIPTALSLYRKVSHLRVQKSSWDPHRCCQVLMLPHPPPARTESPDWVTKWFTCHWVPFPRHCHKGQTASVGRRVVYPGFSLSRYRWLHRARSWNYSLLLRLNDLKWKNRAVIWKDLPKGAEYQHVPLRKVGQTYLVRSWLWFLPTSLIHPCTE